MNLLAQNRCWLYKYILKKMKIRGFLASFGRSGFALSDWVSVFRWLALLPRVLKGLEARTRMVGFRTVVARIPFSVSNIDLARTTEVGFTHNLARIVRWGFKWFVARISTSGFSSKLARISSLVSKYNLARIAILGFMPDEARMHFMGFSSILARTGCLDFTTT